MRSTLSENLSSQSCRRRVGRHRSREPFSRTAALPAQSLGQAQSAKFDTEGVLIHQALAASTVAFTYYSRTAMNPLSMGL